MTADIVDAAAPPVDERPLAGRLGDVARRLRTHLGAQRIAYAVGALTFAVYLVMSVRRYQLLRSPSWDLGIFDQAVRNLAAGHAPIVLIKGVGYNVFGDHFHPVIALLVPVYWVFGSAISLLVVQDLLIAVSVVVITRLAVQICGPYAGAAVGVAYAISWGLQAAVVAQFHEVAFALPLIALSLAALVRGHWRACLLWAAPMVFVKEDLGLTVAVIGLLVALRSRGPQRKLGVALAAWGVVWFVVAVELVLPAVNAKGVWDYQSQLPWSTLTDPAAVLRHLFTPGEKIHTALLVFAVGGLVALRSPIALVTLPTFGWRFLSDVPAYWGTDWHYSAILMPIVTVAMLDAVTTLRERPGRADPEVLRRYATVAAPIAAAFAVTFTLVQQLPLTELAHPSFYRTPDRVAVGQAVLRQVPAGASVESDEGLLTYLVEQHDAYWMGRPGNPPPDYFVLDAKTGGWGDPPKDVLAYAEQLHPGAHFVKVFEQDGYTLLQRVDG